MPEAIKNIKRFQYSLPCGSVCAVAVHTRLRTFQYSLPCGSVCLNCYCYVIIHFNTHSLAGVYVICGGQLYVDIFQYSLPCGSVCCLSSIIFASTFQYSLPCGSVWIWCGNKRLIKISILTPLRECMSILFTSDSFRYFNTHSLAGVYDATGWVPGTLYFNTHSLAGVYGMPRTPDKLQRISILTPLRECMLGQLDTDRAYHFNTHSLAGVYVDLPPSGHVTGFQYSLPCGSVWAVAGRRWCQRHFNTHSLAGVYAVCCRNAVITHFNTHSLAGVYVKICKIMSIFNFNTHSLAGVYE